MHIHPMADKLGAVIDTNGFVPLHIVYTLACPHACQHMHVGSHARCCAAAVWQILVVITILAITIYRHGRYLSSSLTRLRDSEDDNAIEAKLRSRP